MTYYMANEIARAMGVAPKNGQNWVDRKILPEPCARTAEGRGLWSAAVAEEFIKLRTEWAQGNTRLKGGRIRAARISEAEQRKLREERQLEIALDVLDRGA
ncbi:hypothetical protein SEA_RIZWANA_43 [Arthrobacter phage Rizwana]|nr:hypothetical protein SEA_RIZWANA_43 [Arthrobacter phage Rizwana]